MPLTKKDRKKGNIRGNQYRTGWPSAPKSLIGSNELWMKRMKGRKFTSIKTKKDIELQKETDNKLLRKKQDIIELVGHRLFKVAFIKKDGTLREMTCRLAVKAHCGNGEQTADENKYLVVFDMKSAKGKSIEERKRCYRNVNLDTIQYIKYAGERHFQCQ